MAKKAKSKAKAKAAVPAKPETRSTRIDIRVTPAEKEALFAVAKRKKMNMTALILTLVK